MKVQRHGEMIPVTWPSSAASIRSRPPTSGGIRRSSAVDLEAGRADHRIRRDQPAAQQRRAGVSTRDCWSSGLSPRGQGHATSTPSPNRRTAPTRYRLRSRVSSWRRRRQTRCGNINARRPAAKAPTRTPAVHDGEYPSTHGVRGGSDPRGDIQIVHDRGGQVYMDGANMNAQGRPLTSPGEIGRRRLPPEPAQDVLHPARRRRSGVMGPSASTRNSPFLPGHPVVLANVWAGTRSVSVPARHRLRRASCRSRTRTSR